MGRLARKGGDPMKWWQVVMAMIKADPVAFATKLVRLAMLVGGAVSVVLAKFGIEYVPNEADWQMVIGSLAAAVALVWSFKNDADLNQQRPVQ